MHNFKVRYTKTEPLVWRSYKLDFMTVNVYCCKSSRNETNIHSDEMSNERMGQKARAHFLKPKYLFHISLKQKIKT